MLAIIKLHMCKYVNLLASLEVEIMKCPLNNATSCAEKYSKAEKFKISKRNMGSGANSLRDDHLTSY